MHNRKVLSSQGVVGRIFSKTDDYREICWTESGLPKGRRRVVDDSVPGKGNRRLQGPPVGVCSTLAGEN